MPQSYSPVYFPADWSIVSMGANNVVADSPLDDSSKEVTLYPALDGINTTYQQGTLSNNNKRMTVSSGNWSGYRINMPVTSGGKIYFEFVIGGHSGQGAGLTTIVGNIDQPGGGSPYVGKTGNYSMQRESGFWTPGNSNNVPTGHETGSDSAYYKCAYDDSNGKLWFGDADGWYGSSVSDSDVAAGNSNTYTVAADDRGGKLFIYCSGYTNGGHTTLRLLSSEWSSSAPTGFSALTKTVTGVGNYATWSPVDVDYNYVPTFSDGNLTVTGNSGSVYSECRGTIGVSSGKFVIQITPGSTLTNGALFGVCRASDMRGASAISSATGTKGILCRSDNGGQIYSDGSAVQSSLGTWDNGDNMRVEMSADDGTVAFFKNGSAYGSAVSSITFDEPWTFIWMPFTNYAATLEHSIAAMDGTVTSGFKEWNTANLPAPTVTNPSDFFKTVLYTANNTDGHEISTVGFVPDFVWIKDRDTAASHVIFDVVRGVSPSANNYVTVNTNDAENQGSFTNTMVQLGKAADGSTVINGFTLDDDSNDQRVNYGGSMVAWCWKAGGAASSNGNGSITSQVSAASHGGFSIITYTGNGSNGATIGHGLSKAAEFQMFRRRNAGNDFHVSTNITGSIIGAELNNPTNSIGGGAVAAAVTAFNATTTAVVGPSGVVNDSGNTYVSYAFARTPGLIGIGTYAGNNSTNGTYVIIDDGASGFRPAWVMLKNLNDSENWVIFDSARSTFNPVDGYLSPVTTAGDGSATGLPLDFTANGFKQRGNSNMTNEDTILYLAFAELPFGGSGVAQARAR